MAVAYKKIKKKLPYNYGDDPLTQNAVFKHVIAFFNWKLFFGIIYYSIISSGG
jgi:hypothetical protein